jgi:type II secretory pathway component PulF
MAELAVRLSELTASGVPLGDGLRAAADEQPRRRAAASLRGLAARIDAGEPLDAALAEASRGGGVDAGFQRLLLFGARHNCLAEVLDQSIDLAARRASLRRQLWSAIAYPTVLIVATCAAWVVLEAFALVPIWTIYTEFGTELPDLTLLAVASGRVSLAALGTMVVLLGFAAIAFPLGRRRAFTWRLLSALPILGPMWRWQSRAELARQLAFALGNGASSVTEAASAAPDSTTMRPSKQLPMHEAVRLAAADVADAELARQCHQLAAELESGRPAAEAFTGVGPFSRNPAAVFQWAEDNNAWHEAFQSLAAWYERLVRSCVRLIEVALPLLMVMIVVTMVLMIRMAILLPMISIVRVLTDWTVWDIHPPPDGMDLTNAYITVGVLAGLWASILAAPVALGALQVHGPDHRRKTRAAVRRVRIILLAIAVPFSLVLFTAVAGPVFLVLLVVIGPMIVIQRNQARRETILGLVTTSLRRGIPVETTLSAFAGQLGRGTERRAQRLAERLRQGEPLIDALRATPGLISREAIPLLALELQSGSLSTGVSTNAEAAGHGSCRAAVSGGCAIGAQERLEAARHALAGKGLYVLGVLAYIIGIVIYVAWQIVPALVKIFEDFDMALPPATLWLVALSYRVELFAAPVVLLPFMLFVYAVLRLGNGVPWDLPGIGRLLRPLDAANVLDAMSIGVEGRRPLPETIHTLAETYPKPGVRGRLRKVYGKVLEGADWIDSLLASRLLRPAEAAVLRSAAAVGNLPWAMRAMAESSRRRFAYRSTLALQVVFTLLIVALALAAALFAVAMLSPLLHIALSLT